MKLKRLQYGVLPPVNYLSGSANIIARLADLVKT